MNFNHKALIILIASSLLIVFMLIFAKKRVEAQTFKGSHDTAYIRYLWFYCEKGLNQRRPDMPEFFRGLFCDCLLDKIRITVDKDELERMLSQERQLLFQNLTNECIKQKEEELI